MNADVEGINGQVPASYIHCAKDQMLFVYLMLFFKLKLIR